MIVVIYRKPEESNTWKLLPAIYLSMGEAVAALSDPQWKGTQVQLASLEVSQFNQDLVGLGGPQVCRECYGFGGRDTRGGPGPCERCHRIGKGLNQ